jgi:hypothetical protein
VTILLLLASLSWGQSTGTPSISLQDQLEISNLGKAVKALENGKPVIPGQPRYINGICFDSAGTDCQTTAATSYTDNRIYISSFPAADISSALTSGGKCYSSATWTATLSTATAYILGDFSQSGAGQSIKVGFLLNGAFTTPYTSSRARATDRVDSANFIQTRYIPITFTGLTVGQTYTACLTIWASAGTSSITCTGNSACEFAVRE